MRDGVLNLFGQPEHYVDATELLNLVILARSLSCSTSSTNAQSRDSRSGKMQRRNR